MKSSITGATASLALFVSSALIAPAVVSAQVGAPVGTAGARRANGAAAVTPAGAGPVTPGGAAPVTPGGAAPVTATPNPEPGTAAKPDLSARIQSLYASASYEEALAAMPAPDSAVSRDVEQYRALCLLALGRQPEAAASVARVVSQDALFVPPAEDTPPRLQAMYKDARARLAPGLAKAAYAEAKAAWEKKDGVAAHAAFQRTVDIIALVPDAAAAGLGDLRELASGFVQLTAAAAGPGGPSSSSPGGNAAGSSAPGSVASNQGAAAGVPATGLSAAPGGKPTLAAGGAPAANTTSGPGAAPAEEGAWQGPMAIRQDMPGWQPPDASSRRLEYHGRIRIFIDSTGHVDDVRVLKPSHPAYDAAVIRAARLWSFTPATRGGRAVSSEKEIEVNLRPQ